MTDTQEETPRCILCVLEAELEQARGAMEYWWAKCREAEQKLGSFGKPHKTMTPEEYAAMPLKGWHQVCKDVDGFGSVGIRYMGEVAPQDAMREYPTASSPAALIPVQRLPG